MAAAKKPWADSCRIGLIVLAVVVFALDFAHGVHLGRDRVAFEPVYRLRQSLAIAVSRLHNPPVHHYVVAGSVEQVFNDNGFAQRENEHGVNGGVQPGGWPRLVNDGAELNQIMRSARTVPLNPHDGSSILDSNELGYADYAEAAFRLFGLSVGSLYWFYFVLLGISVSLFLLEFHASPFRLFLLVAFLACQYFLQDYAIVFGTQLNTVQNSRLFDALALLPAAHVAFVVWRRRLPDLWDGLAVVVQIGLLVFLVTCRYQAMWEVAALYALGGLVILCLTWRAWRSQWRREVFRDGVRLWPVIALGVALVGTNAYVHSVLDPRYDVEPKTHLFWHAVLLGLLSYNPTLLHLYTEPGDDITGDKLAHVAIAHDLNRRHDASSPLARTDPQTGKIVLFPFGNYIAYETLAKSLALRMVRDHPLLVAAEVPAKIRGQIAAFRTSYLGKLPFRRGLVAFPLTIALVGAELCAFAGGFRRRVRPLADAAVVGAVFLAFSLVTPLIEPSPLAVGTMFAWLIASAAALAAIVAIPLEWLADTLQPARRSFGRG